MDTPAPYKGVHEDVEILLVVVPALDDVPAVAIDEGRQMGSDGGVTPKYRRPALEVADPKIVRVVPSPSTAHLLF